MKLKLTLAMDNAAFEDGADGRLEVARILKRIATDLRNGYMRGSPGTDKLWDANGNHVGNISIQGQPARAAATPESDGDK